MQRSNKDYLSPEEISGRIYQFPPSPMSVQRMINSLLTDKMIEIIIDEEFIKCRLGKKGVIFCEFSSYAYPGFPVVTKEERKKSYSR